MQVVKYSRKAVTMTSREYLPCNTPKKEEKPGVTLSVELAELPSSEL